MCVCRGISCRLLSVAVALELFCRNEASLPVAPALPLQFKVLYQSSQYSRPLPSSTALQKGPRLLQLVGDERMAGVLSPWTLPETRREWLLALTSLIG